MASPGEQLTRAWARGALRPDPPVTVSEWADTHRVLSSVASAEPGRWRTKRTPYLRAIMDDLSSYSTVQEVVVMKGAQVGLSEAGLNFVGYAIHHAPGPAMYVMPTVETVKRLSKTRLDPMIEASPALSERIAPSRSRDAGNTIFAKEYPGGALILTGANSAAGLRSMPIRQLVLDEVDAFPPSADDEGDPVNLAKARTQTFARRKILLLSTPTIKGFSRIGAAFREGNQRYYHVPCDGCGTLQPIFWQQIKWPKGEPEAAVFECRECGHQHEEHRKGDLLSEARGAEWVPSAEPKRAGVRSYHLSSLYSPWKSWGECAVEFMAAKDDPPRLQVFVNTVLGEEWDEADSEAIDAEGLLARREEYAAVVPHEVALLTAAVDVQDDRLEFLLVGWGRDEESWAIEHRIISGDPSAPAVWATLDELLDQAWPHPSEPDKGMRIAATCVDTGGHHTQRAYEFCRGKSSRRIWPIKGRAGRHPIWPRRPSRNNKGKVPLFLIGVDAAKDTIVKRLPKMGQPGPGSPHYPMDFDAEFFEQLTAERRRTKYRAGQPILYWWKPDGARNEALDLSVYAYAALQGLIAMGLRLNLRARQVAERAADNIREGLAPAAAQKRPRVSGVEAAHEAPPSSDKKPRRKRNRVVRSSYM